MAKTNNNRRGSVFKRLLGNRNTVTLLGIIACIGVLVVGYNIRVNNAINPRTVPYAKQNIPARTLIDESMLGKIKISSTYASSTKNLITNVNEIVGNYASYKTNIPKGSLIYDDMIKTAEEMPDAAFANIENNYTVFSLSVDSKSTFANSIRAGDYIDLYMSTTVSSGESSNSDKLIVYGKLIESIRVLAVKDSLGENILKNGLSYGKPAELLFAVSNENYLLLMEAKFLDNIEIEPILRNEHYTAQAKETLVSSNYLKSLIQDRVSPLSTN